MRTKGVPLAALCGLLLLAGCGGGTERVASTPVDGFEVHAGTEAAAVVQAAPQRRTPGCIPVRQDDAEGARTCMPKREVCKRGAIWWTPDPSEVCAPLTALPVRMVSAPEELPVGAALCVVWAGTPSKVREAVLVVASAHANCVTGVVGTVVGPPADPLATAFPTRRPDCGSYYPGTRRAWPAKVTFVEPPGRAWACFIG